jgi:hypothetical protein
MWKIDRYYKEQPFFDKINSMMRELGFIFKGCWEQLKSSVDGSILQADSIFIKRGDS